MKLMLTFAAGAAALLTLAAPAVAQHKTVQRAHGPAKPVPHNNRKVCQVKYDAHHRAKKC